MQVVKYFKTKKEFGQYQLSKKDQAHMEDETKPRYTQESQTHRMAWVGRDLKDNLVPTSSEWERTSPTRPCCSEPHPAWP